MKAECNSFSNVLHISPCLNYRKLLKLWVLRLLLWAAFWSCLLHLYVHKCFAKIVVFFLGCWVFLLLLFGWFGFLGIIFFRDHFFYLCGPQLSLHENQIFIKIVTNCSTGKSEKEKSTHEDTQWGQEQQMIHTGPLPMCKPQQEGMRLWQILS